MKESESITIEHHPLSDIWEDIRSGDKGADVIIQFLNAVDSACIAAEKGGRETLAGPYSKADVVETITVPMEKLSNRPVAIFIYTCYMITISNLSKFKPPLSPELESRVLRAVVRRVISHDSRSRDACSQMMHKEASAALVVMLQRLLAENPTTEHLLQILGHFKEWIISKVAEEKAEAIKTTTALQIAAYHQLNVLYDVHEMRKHQKKLWT